MERSVDGAIRSRLFSGGRSHRLLVGAAAILVAALFLLNPLAAASGPDKGVLTLEELVGPDTLLFLKCSGAEQLIEQSRSLDLVRLWEDPEIQAFLAELKAMIPGMLETDGDSGWPVEEVWNLFNGDLAVAFSSRLAIFTEGAMPTPTLAVDLKGNKEQFLNTLTRLLNPVLAENTVEKNVHEYRGFEIQSIGRPCERIEICYTTIKNLFVATLNPYHLHNLIDRRLDRGPSLAQEPAFVRSRDRIMGSGAGLMAFMNFKPLIDLGRALCPYELSSALEMEGIDKIDGFSIGSRLEKGGSRDSVFIHCPGEKKGMLKALAPHSITWDDIGQVPPDALYYLAVVFDPQLIFKEIDRFVRTVVPEAYEDFQAGLKEIEQETGFNLENELLEPLGSELSFWVTMPQSGGMAMIPDLMLAVELDDAKRFTAFQEKLISMVEGEVDIVASQYNDHTLRHIVIPGAPFSPAFTLEGGKLLVAGTPMTLKKYLQWRAKGEPGLDQTEAFKAAVLDVPKNASVFKYVNMKRGVEIGYGAAGPFLPALLAEADLPLDVGLLPMTETVAEYFSGIACYVTMEDDGIFMSGRSVLGLGVLLAIGADVIDHFAEQGLLHGALEQMAKLDKPDGDPLLNGAYGLMGAERYEEAEALLTQWLDKNTRGSQGRDLALLNRGYCRLKIKRYKDGIEDYKTAAEEAPARRPLANYNIACGYALLGETDNAIAALETSIDAGWNDLNLMESDSDLDSIRDDPRYQALKEKLR